MMEPSTKEKALGIAIDYTQKAATATNMGNLKFADQYMELANFYRKLAKQLP